jgi:hypothetical protein
MHVTLVHYQKADFPEIFWLKRLLPGISVQQIEDLSQTKVFPGSIVISKWLGSLRSDLLNMIAATPGVVLFHISDEWYLDPWDRYRCFVHVIRNYHHPFLRQEGITQIPIGPSRDPSRAHEMRSVTERSYIWSFAGNLASTRRSLVNHLSSLKPNFIHISGAGTRKQKLLNPEQYLGILGDSVFVPCPMGNVNLETFRLYEALDSGAIPIVERRHWLDYFTELFGPHPLPSVRNWMEAPALINSLRSDRVRLCDKQIEIREWWQRLEKRISTEVTSIISRATAQKARMTFAPSAPSRLSGICEMLKHHNATALWARSQLTIRRLWAAGLRMS